MAEPIRLYLDEDSQRASLVRALRSRQVDVITCNEANLVEEDDAVQLAYATAENRVVFTFNRGDFVQLHTQYLNSGRSHAGIIVSDQLGTGVILRRLLKLINARPAVFGRHRHTIPSAGCS